MSAPPSAQLSTAQTGPLNIPLTPFASLIWGNTMTPSRSASHIKSCGTTHQVDQVRPEREEEDEDPEQLVSAQRVRAQSGEYCKAAACQEASENARTEMS